MIVKSFADSDVKRAEVWHVIARRGEDLEVLTESHATHEQARAAALRMRTFVPGSDFGTVSSLVDFTRLELLDKDGAPIITDVRDRQTVTASSLDGVA